MDLLNLTKCRPLDLVEPDKFEYFQMKKSGYVEQLYENALRAYTSETFGEFKNVHETLSVIDE